MFFLCNAFQLYTYSCAQQNFVMHAHGRGKRERKKKRVVSKQPEKKRNKLFIKASKDDDK